MLSAREQRQFSNGNSCHSLCSELEKITNLRCTLLVKRMFGKDAKGMLRSISPGDGGKHRQWGHRAHNSQVQGTLVLGAILRHRRGVVPGPGDLRGLIQRCMAAAACPTQDAKPHPRGTARTCNRWRYETTNGALTSTKRCLITEAHYRFG